MVNKVVTFGCRLNFYESEIIKKNADSSQLENTIIFNSCAVTQEAERQLQQSIRRYRKENPGKQIIVTGCASQINPQKYAKMPEVDAVIGNEEKNHVAFYNKVIESADKILVNDIMSVKETAPQMIDGYQTKVRAFLQIQNGCNHRCTFCTIPFGRGNSRSVPIAQVVLQAQKLLENGYDELVLTGVDLTSYGEDLPGQPKLGQLVRRLLNIVPIKRLRLSSIDVAEIDEELHQLYINEKRLMPHLHLSLQAGDNMILKRMKRRHNREQVIEFCNNLQKLRPEVTFGADIIAGFPTETEEMFLNSCRIIQQAHLIYLHVFPYSPRDNTPASRMPQVPKSIAKKRAKVLRELGQKQLTAHYAKSIGKKMSVIVESDGLARAEDYSVVKMQDIAKYETGDILDVLITSHTDTYLNGEVIRC